MQALAKKLLGGSGVISAMAVHPSGDHVIVGSEDKRLAWCVIYVVMLLLCYFVMLTYVYMQQYRRAQLTCLHHVSSGSKDKRLAW